MLLQTLMQLSQMYTPGPAISLRTSAWLLPQKEHMVRLEARAILRQQQNFANLRKLPHSRCSVEADPPEHLCGISQPRRLTHKPSPHLRTSSNLDRNQFAPVRLICRCEPRECGSAGA